MGVTQNMLTIIGLLLSGITALVIAQGHLFVGGLLIPFAGILTCLMGQWHRFKTQLQALAHF